MAIELAYLEDQVIVSSVFLNAVGVVLYCRGLKDALRYAAIFYCANYRRVMEPREGQN